MKKFAVLLILLAFCTVFAHGQAIRADIPLLTSGPNVPVTGYPLPQALIVANATIALCNHPSVNLAACTPIVTYTSSAGSATCLSTKPLVQLPGTTCSATTGLLGDIGFWYAGGTIDYFVTTMYGTYGPYSYSGGTGGAAGRWRRNHHYRAWSGERSGKNQRHDCSCNGWPDDYKLYRRWRGSLSRQLPVQRHNVVSARSFEHWRNFILRHHWRHEHECSGHRIGRFTDYIGFRDHYGDHGWEPVWQPHAAFRNHDAIGHFFYGRYLQFHHRINSMPARK